MSPEGEPQPWYPEAAPAVRGRNERVWAVTAMVVILGAGLFGLVRTVRSGREALTPTTRYFTASGGTVACAYSEFPQRVRSSGVTCVVAGGGKVGAEPCSGFGVARVFGNGTVEFSCAPTGTSPADAPLVPGEPTEFGPVVCADNVLGLVCTVSSGKGFSISGNQMKALAAF